MGAHDCTCQASSGTETIKLKLISTHASQANFVLKAWHLVIHPSSTWILKNMVSRLLGAESHKRILYKLDVARQMMV